MIVHHLGDAGNGGAPTHHPELCGLDEPGPRSICPGCRPLLLPAPGPTPAELRCRKRGQRLAALVRRHADELTPVLVELLAPAVGEIAAAVAGEQEVR
jgi:hypothetical protein